MSHSPLNTQFRRLLRSRVALILFALICVFFAGRIVRLVDKAHETRANLTRAESQHETLAKQKEDLEKSLSRLSTDEGMEAALRQKFSVVHDGEDLTVVVDPSEMQASAAESAPKIPWWKRIFGRKKATE